MSDFASRLADLDAATARAAERVARSRALLARLQPAAAPAPATDLAYEAFARRLAADGVRAALAGVLEASDYRYIAIFRFEDGKANAAVYVDRENPEQLQAQEVPDTATYCLHVRRDGGAFATDHAEADPLLADHPARAVVQAYCGVPVTAPDGGFIGTLCHYDLVPREATQLDAALLLRVAADLGQPGVVPPYPRAG